MRLLWKIPGTQTTLPAYIVPPQATRNSSAWLSGYVTIRLTEGIDAVRAHVRPGVHAVPADVHFAENAGPAGYWFGIGAFVQAYAQSLSQRLEQNPMTEIAMIYVHSGTSLNVGIGAPLFGRVGSGGQAEFVSGPSPRMETLDMYLVRSAGSRGSSWIPVP